MTSPLTFPRNNSPAAKRLSMAASTTESSSDTVFSRLSELVSENKKAILIGAGVTAAVVGGGAYYYYTQTNRSLRGSDEDAEDVSEKGTRKPKDKKKNKSKKKKAAKDADGPILEERKAASVVDDADIGTRDVYSLHMTTYETTSQTM
ncbi:hypothetical protein SISNIDRAFT_362162 [Sistotremastrum niveocremeum HHB9708]|uniref:Uncharacterized protein n=1 Tax=Sistotremastrum niveocremeum HHB9708 TaxID=1314777 RepID=A0A164WSE8_9AGAM|nr:hypothetical protein SISNIDRAFT_362162 [Sistotremastrum niveocremeum HHB9708]